VKKKTKAKPAKKTKSAKKSVVKSMKPAGKLAKAAAVIGKELPALTLPSTGGRTVNLQDLLGKHIVLYFYPKDATPGCTLEGHDFTRLYDQFKATNTVIFGISRDSIKSHEKFKECESYSFDLLSDEDETVCKLFGVIKMKNMYGKQVRGIERSTFVIDSSGQLVKEWRGVKVAGHADEVLMYVKSL
jgi:peroxiredoxin Q/BCP